MYMYVNGDWENTYSIPYILGANGSCYSGHSVMLSILDFATLKTMQQKSCSK